MFYKLPLGQKMAKHSKDEIIGKSPRNRARIKPLLVKLFPLDVYF